MAEVTTYVCDGYDEECADCTAEATVTVTLGFPGRGAPHDEREVTLELDLCDEHVTSWRGFYRPQVNAAAEMVAAGEYACAKCGKVSPTGAGLAAHQRATGHKGRA